MPNDKNRLSSRGTFFFTVMLERDAPVSLISELSVLRAVYAETLSSSPFETLAIVILPDHLHAIWRLPQGDLNYALRWRRIKTQFSRQVEAKLQRETTRARASGFKLWEPRNWEQEIRSETDLLRHMAYCWSDPVRHGVAHIPSEWEASSFHREVRAGLIPSDWTTGPIRGEFGERPVLSAA
jgi:putative transposase